MPDLLHPWGTYVRIQTALLRRRRLSDQSWGMEAALDAILLSFQDNRPVTSDDLTCAAASARRRERYRAHLRLAHLSGGEVGADPYDALAAREKLRITRSMVSSRDWSVLRQVAEGYSYAEVAAQTRGTPGGLRVRVLRCRQQVAAKAA